MGNFNQQPVPVRVGGKTLGIYNWWVLTGGLDGNGNPVTAQYNADGTASSSAKQYDTSSSSTPITTDGTVFTLAAGEKGFLQNLDDAAVYVKYGTGASSSSFNFVLKAGTASNDGLGGYTMIDDWIGVVSIAAATGSPRVIATKLSNA